MTAVRRLNHAVLYVRDARKSAAFYQEAFGFEKVTEAGDGFAVFLRAAETDNHHDLGLFTIGANAPGPERGRAGLYHLAWQVDTIQDLAAMRDRLGSRMSGGEQQMLAIARTLMGNPTLVLLDEPSEGLAPKIVEQMAETIRALKSEGLTILVSEQNLHFAKLIADEATIIEKGRIRFSGSMQQLAADQDMQREYLVA